MKKIYFFLCMILCSTGAWAQTTYTWNQTGSAAWTTAANWTPTRTTPATNDILVFDNGATTTATAVPAETIGALLVSAGTKLTLNTATPAKTLTIGGVAGVDLSVASGCQLNIAITVAATPITISLLTGATGSISGAMTFSSATSATANQLLAADASAITFNSGSIFAQSTNSTGSVFGTAGTANTIIFASGSTFVQGAGSNPFGLTQPNSKVVFQTGSLYKIIVNQAPAATGRTYANFEWATGGTTNLTGATGYTVDDVIITSGTLGLNLTGASNIKGNISVASGATLNFIPAAATSLTFSGTAAQSITNAGTLTFAANEAVVIANTNGVTFNNNQTVSGTMTVNAGSTLATSGVLTLTGSPAINGSFKLNQGGSETGGTMTYGASSTLIYGGTTAQTASPSEFPAANGPASVSLDNAGGVILPASFSRTIGNLNLNNGTLALGANNLTISGTVSGGSSTSYIKTNGFGTVTVNNIGAETLVPLGNAKYNPVTIQNGSGHNWVVRVEDGLTTDPGFPSDKAVLVTWNITPSVNPPAGPANIVFQFDEATQVGPNFSLAENVQAWYRIASWHAAGSPVAAVGIAGEKKVTVNGLTHFSPYAISNVSGPLPISINYFNGIKQGNDHLLNWKVNSNSSATIILERSSDGRNYKEIYSINATAQRCQQPFEYTNAQPLAGINYYRLKMTDANGKMSYSNTVALLNEQSGFELVSIAPNPVQSDGRAILNVTAAEAGTLQIIVTDMNGSKIMTQNETLQAGSKQVVLNLSRLTTGTYQVTAFYSDGTKKTLRLVKQ